MKKAFFYPLLLLTIALPSCGNGATSSETSSADSSVSSSVPTEDVNKLKDLLSKQDLSPIYDKMFVSQFEQNYEAYSSNNGGNEEEAESHFYTYSGVGMFGCLYEVSEEAYAEAESLGDPDFFDFLSRGKGSYAMLQQGTLVSYLYEADEEEIVKSLQCLDFLQEVEARFTDDNVQVVNSLFHKDTLDGGFNIDTRQYFNGLIDKKTLFDTITVRAFSDIFARTNLFDGQRSCEVLDRIYFATVEELCAKSDAELGDFVTKNAIRIEDEEETTLVHFAVGNENLRAVLDENEIIPGTFEGTLTYEKESGKFTAFDYRIVYATHEVDETSGYVHNTSMEFKAEGYSLNQKYDEDLYIDPNPTVYDHAETFLEDVVEEVIPPAF